MTEIALFFAGALLCNAIPHLAAGTRGEPFPTPFAKPHGVGMSSPLANRILSAVVPLWPSSKQEFQVGQERAGFTARR